MSVMLDRPDYANTETDLDIEFQDLFDEHAKPMVCVAQRILLNRAEAEEVVQDAFVELYQRWEVVRTPVGYLRTTVVNRARRVVRRRLRRLELQHHLAKIEMASEPDYLLDALAQLPERERLAVTLAYYEGLTGAEIAALLNCAEGTARSLVSRGLRRLALQFDPPTVS